MRNQGPRRRKREQLMGTGWGITGTEMLSKLQQGLLCGWLPRARIGVGPKGANWLLPPRLGTGRAGLSLKPSKGAEFIWYCSRQRRPGVGAHLDRVRGDEREKTGKGGRARVDEVGLVQCSYLGTRGRRAAPEKKEPGLFPQSFQGDVTGDREANPGLSPDPKRLETAFVDCSAETVWIPGSETKC